MSECIHCDSGTCAGTDGWCVAKLRTRLKEAEKIVKSGGQAIHDLLQQLAVYRMALKKIANSKVCAHQSQHDYGCTLCIAREALKENGDE